METFKYLIGLALTLALGATAVTLIILASTGIIGGG